MVRPHLTNEQLDHLTTAFRKVCHDRRIDPKGHEALRIAARLLEEADGTESIEELSDRFAA